MCKIILNFFRASASNQFDKSSLEKAQIFPENEKATNFSSMSEKELLEAAEKLNDQLNACNKLLRKDLPLPPTGMIVLPPGR